MNEISSTNLESTGKRHRIKGTVLAAVAAKKKPKKFTRKTVIKK